MKTKDIINLANLIKETYNTTNTFKICEKLGIPINYMHLKPNIYPAYTLKVTDKPTIVLNEHFTFKSQEVLCAHELGHALLHNKKLLNQFNDENNGCEEYEANLFAVALLFNQDDLSVNIQFADNYILKSLLDYNIHLK